MLNDVMTETVNIPHREPLDKSSDRYLGVHYQGICRASKSLILEFLKTCFENLPDGHIFKFHEDDKYSKIAILDKHTFNLDEVDKRPALVVDRGAVRYTKSGKDQNVQTGTLQRREDPTGQYEGKTVKTGLFRGALTIQCYGKGQTLQSELLGDSVFELVTNMEDVLKKIGFFECYSTGIGAEVPTLVGAKVKYIMVPISVHFSMQRTWSITPTNLRKLRNIILKKLTANEKDMI